ncbi:MAG: TonB-dependent receptor, partial [Pyrinomonadaceae bacterium]
FLTRGQTVLLSFRAFLGGNTSFSVLANGIKERKLRTADYHVFAQDDWKITPRLTLNLGLRYELDLPPYDTLGRLSAFDASLYRPPPSPSDLPAGGIVQAGNAINAYDLSEVPNVDRRVLHSIDPNNFAPRFGFAFKPFKSGRFVVRGGCGVYYSRPSFQSLVGSIYSPPFYFVGINGPGNLTAPFAPVPAENEFPTLAAGPLGLSGVTFDRNNRTPYIQQYQVSTQLALTPNTLLEVAYVGTRGVKLLRRVAINQARLASPENPVFNPVTNTWISTNTPGNTQARAPFQGVSASGGPTGYNQDQTTGQSSYNSLQVTLSRRNSNGLQFLAAYTFGESIDNGSGIGGGSGRIGLLNPATINDASSVVGNQLDNRADRGLSDFDRTHRLVTNVIWELPKPAFVRTRKVGRVLFSGWLVSGIVTVMSGLPIDVFDGSAGNLYFGPLSGNGRPNLVPGRSPASNIPPGYYFNPYAFARPIVLAGQVIPSSGGWATASATGTDFGNAGRNILRGPRQFNVDLSMSKRFALGEARSIEMRAEFFNLFNTVNYANPASNFGSASQIDPVTGQIPPGQAGNFGKIQSTSNNPRLIQFALKFNF